MKRKEKLAIALFSTLLLLSFANSSMAAPPSYVGVAIGDEFVWRPSLNMANVNTTMIGLIGEENWTIAYDMILELYENNTGMEFGSFSGAGLKVVVKNVFVVKNVSDEITFAPGIFGSNLTMDIYTSAGLNNWTSVVFNYTMFVNYVSTMIADDPYMNGNITIQTQGRGFKFTLKAAYLESSINMTEVPFNFTLGDIDFIVRWNINGVFEYGSIDYGGLTIVSIQLITVDDIIPGFEIVTIIGVSITTIIAIVYIKRKKNIQN